MDDSYFIGTSGWHYHGWIGNLYPDNMKPENMLEFYASKFNSVELNTSFYGIPSKKSIEKWCEITPPDFIFSCKASRYLTHIKKLDNYGDGLHYMLDRFECFSQKMGPVLFQFPPTWQLNYDRLEKFLKVLPSSFSYTFEFRHTSWLCPQIFELLKKYNMALCFYDFKQVCAPEVLTGNFVYLRMHGPHLQPYTGHYDNKILKEYAEKIIKWQNNGYKIFGYFDNDEKTCAPVDAVNLKKIIVETGKINENFI